MADIVLSTINAKWIHPSLALRLLKANLGEYEDRCEIVELALRQSSGEMLGILAQTRPKILGLSVSIWNHKASLELLKGLRNIWKKEPRPAVFPASEPEGSGRPVIVLGGPEISCLPEESEIIRCADFVIRGEGEKAFAELCKRILNNENLPSRSIDGGAVDLAGIRSAYHLYSDEDLRRKLIYVEASRDCPFACAFCQSAIKTAGSRCRCVQQEAESAGKNSRQKSLREFPLDGFLSDMERLLDRLFSVRLTAGETLPRPTLKFLDRSFNVNIPRALSVMEFFLEKASPEKASPAVFSGAKSGGSGRSGTFQLHFEMVPSLFPPELARMISRFPPDTLRLELGIQSLNPRVCAAINRPSYPEKELETLGFLRGQTNAIVHADLIAGLPGEDLASFGEGFDRLWRALTSMETPSGETPLRGSLSFEIQLGILKGLPGTPLRELDEKFGMVYSPEPPYEVIETAALGREDLDRLRNFARFWELIVNRPWKTNDRSRNNAEESAAGVSLENPARLPSGEPVFWTFMDLAERLFRVFRRNWGIDRNALRAAIPEKPIPGSPAGIRAAFG